MSSGCDKKRLKTDPFDNVSNILAFAMKIGETGKEMHTESFGRVAGIDYGTVRIGVAVSDPDRLLASPYETYVRKSESKDAEYFKRLVTEERIMKFVVGLPLHLSGQVSDKAREVLLFGAWLRGVTGIDVDYVDERFTSVEAEHYLRQAKLTNKKRKERRDKIAAQILLSTYLESGCRGISDFQGIDD